MNSRIFPWKGRGDLAVGFAEVTSEHIIDLLTQSVGMQFNGEMKVMRRAHLVCAPFTGQPDNQTFEGLIGVGGA